MFMFRWRRWIGLICRINPWLWALLACYRLQIMVRQWWISVMILWHFPNLFNAVVFTILSRSTKVRRSISYAGFHCKGTMSWTCHCSCEFPQVSSQKSTSSTHSFLLRSEFRYDEFGWSLSWLDRLLPTAFTPEPWGNCSGKLVSFETSDNFTFISIFPNKIESIVYFALVLIDENDLLLLVISESQVNVSRSVWITTYGYHK